jgi:alpha-aminoadipate carrier protein LysW
LTLKRAANESQVLSALAQEDDYVTLVASDPAVAQRRGFEGKRTRTEKRRGNVTIVFCIECDQPIKLECRPVKGEIITCSSCGADLKVVSADPVELDWAYLESVESEERNR